MKPFRFLCQDESGEVGRGQTYFIVGLLMVREREPLWNAIRRARDRWHYANELHFSKMSDLRQRVYESVFEEVAKHEALSIRRSGSASSRGKSRPLRRAIPSCLQLLHQVAAGASRLNQQSHKCRIYVCFHDAGLFRNQ